MSNNSKIEWTDRTWNPITGCDKVSQGCKFCYAEVIANRFSRVGIIPNSEIEYSTADAPKSEKFTVLLHPDRLDQPLRWRKPSMVFVNSMSDLFHESVPVSYIAKVYAIAFMSPQHKFQILTKRPERALHILTADNFIELVWKYANQLHDKYIKPLEQAIYLNEEICFDNVWLGVSVEDQKTADERIPILLQIPAAVRWLSVEPMLGGVDISKWLMPKKDCEFYVNHPTEEEVKEGVTDCLRYENSSGKCKSGYCPLGYCNNIDWVVCGGESGHGARPMHPDWARKLRDDCISAGVPFFFKQWGEWCPEQQSEFTLTDISHNDVAFWSKQEQKKVHLWVDGLISYKLGKHKSGRLLDGVEYNEYPK